MSIDDLLRDFNKLRNEFKALQTRDKGGNLTAFSPAPTLTGSTSGAATTYTTQSGNYIKASGVCHFWIVLTWTASTAVGNARVSGMPFAIAAGAEASFSVLSANYAYTNAGIRGDMSGGATFIALFDQVVGAFAPLAVDAAASLIISGAYPV